jgi:hypothetical protein
MDSHKTHDETVYRMTPPDAPWGDYGIVLYCGYAYREYAEATLEIERTGPFCPPIFLPSSGFVVVNSQMRAAIESERFSGISFRDVVKRKIVKVNWETWDMSAEEPPIVPRGGEPEGYIRRNRHSPETSLQMGDLWEVVLSDGADIRCGDDYPIVFEYVDGSWGGSDLFAATEVGGSYCSARFARWIMDRFSTWVKVTPLKVFSSMG